MTGIGVFHRPDLEIASAETSSFTAVTGSIHPVTLTSVTADLVLTFPSSPSTDDSFGVYVSAAHSSGGTSSFANRPFFCVEPANTTSINGSSYSSTSGDGGSEYSLWAAGESLTFVYDGSTWLVTHDGRIPHICHAKRTTAQAISNTTVTSVSYDSTSIDNVSLHSTTTIDCKRKGTYTVTGVTHWESNSTGIRYCQVAPSSGDTVYRVRKVSTGESEAPIAGQWVATPATTLGTTVYQDSGGSLNLNASGNYVSIAEVL